MKILLDACVWGGAVSALRSAGHDVDWVGNWSADPGDEEILAVASARGQVLVTLDKDFGELAVVHRRPHRGIVRLVDLSARSQGHACAAVLRRYGEELAEGALVTVDPRRIRIRPPETGRG
ncbi:MAG: DUF5615 family PIN-like protein [Acidobacteria bacterium]|nr:DUF5615 family PIN-like protein [Acidobacteriota bacterium]